jgi:hypothetical protein
MRRALRIHSHSHAGCTRLTLYAGGKKSTHARESTLHLPTTAHLPCFISFRGKKSRRILFEQASYLTAEQKVGILNIQDSQTILNKKPPFSSMQLLEHRNSSLTNEATVSKLHTIKDIYVPNEPYQAPENESTFLFSAPQFLKQHYSFLRFSRFFSLTF